MTSNLDQSAAPRGVLLTSNLLFSSMVTQTASALGRQIAIAGDVAEAVELCLERPAAYFIIDLGIPETNLKSVISRLREAAGPVPAIAFGSHLDKARLDEARAAGCDEVMPRSKFSAELPALLSRYFAGNR